MKKLVFAFALMASSGAALAYQQQPAPVGETTEEAAPAEEAEAASEEVQVSAEDDYRAAAKAYRKCRQNAHMQGGAAAATSGCTSQRKRMLAAKEALQEAK